MKAITLYQPFASLIAVGVKTIETRSWSPPANLIGHRIAIHAGKRKPRLRETPGSISWYWVKELPLGAVVATAKLEWVAQVVRVVEDDIAVCQDPTEAEEFFLEIDDYGDFSPRRWLWYLDDFQPIEPPIPARGYQGFWEWDESEMATE